jgi:hypothetical protein
VQDLGDYKIVQLDFRNLALQFVREHKFSMPIQHVELAMKIGAGEAIRQTAKLIKQERIEMENFRNRNNAPR